MVRRIREIMVTLDFIFRLVLYSHEDVLFNIIFLNVFFVKIVASLTCAVYFISHRQFRKIAAFAMLFLGFGDQTIA